MIPIPKRAFHAIQTLGMLDPSEATFSFLQKLAENPSDRVLVMLTFALMGTNARPAEPLLRETLKDPDGQTVRYAQWALDALKLGTNAPAPPP